MEKYNSWKNGKVIYGTTKKWRRVFDRELGEKIKRLNAKLDKEHNLGKTN